MATPNNSTPTGLGRAGRVGAVDDAIDTLIRDRLQYDLTGDQMRGMREVDEDNLRAVLREMFEALERAHVDLSSERDRRVAAQEALQDIAATPAPIDRAVERRSTVTEAMVERAAGEVCEGLAELESLPVGIWAHFTPEQQAPYLTLARRALYAALGTNVIPSSSPTGGRG